ncbi:monovalent cation/H+ antiporter subunit D family protein [Emcibacter sp.]|uniref:monovalent cation/H+ antiporter subunit D family protein n=1 Tax=Emcibacter sp. TaxID=1979954 RepID=UPI002AA8E279|nr:monovalent cation/H+ antiporter subunit D family protein [Emcibacter sp.]
MTLAAHLPALQVALPLAAAPICALLRWRSTAWSVAVLISWLSLLAAIGIFTHVNEHGVFAYSMGGWEPPFGIEFRIDVLNALMLLLVTGVNAVVITWSRLSVQQEIDDWREPMFYAAWLLCVSGLLGITITGDAFNIFVFLEISSLASYILVSCGKDRRSLVAAYKYLIMGSIGATFFLIGVGLLYMTTGTLNLYDISTRLPDSDFSRPVLAAAGFITLGLALKFAMFPLHLWMPNAYTFAPHAVSALLAATSTKVSIYVLLRFEFIVFQPNLDHHDIQFSSFIIPLSVLAIFVGAIAAVYQGNIKRVLAYSSVGQIGYILLGIGLLTVAGLTGGILHLFNHALAKAVLFMAVGCLYFRYGTCQISRMAGCGREMPWTMGAFVIGGLSLIGVPFTAGFISKLYLVRALLEQGATGIILAVLLLIGSLIAVVYIWRIVESAYFRPKAEDSTVAREAPLALLLPTWVMALANIYFGIDPGLPLDMARTAGEQLLGGALL